MLPLLHNFPFDRQRLPIVLEDGEHDATEVVWTLTSALPASPGRHVPRLPQADELLDHVAPAEDTEPLGSLCLG